MLIVKNIALRLALFGFYLSMGVLSLASPRHGRILVDDASEAIERRRGAR